MGKAPCCSKVGLHKGPWSSKEDDLLTNYIQTNGEGQWRSLPKKAGLLRCGKSCRLRWMNYLRPGIKRGNISSDEEDLIIRLHKLLGNRWSLIAGRLPGRTDNEIKNYWNTHLIKRLKNEGIEPMKAKKSLPKKPPKESKKKLARSASETINANKKTQQKIKNSTIGDSNNEAVSAKIKVYVPKPIRVTFPGFSSNNNTVESTLSSSSTSHEQVVNKEMKMAIDEMSDFDWPLLELGDANYGTIEDDQVLIQGCCDFSLEDSIPTISNMLEQVYDEYLQLL